MRLLVPFAIILVSIASFEAQALEIASGQKFCLRDDLGQQFRGCTAQKFRNDFYYRASCPNLNAANGLPQAEVLITEEWTVVFEGEEGCDPIVTARSEIPYYVPRSADDESELPRNIDSERVVRLLYGTNRVAGFENGRLVYSGARDAELRLGSIAVSIPEERDIGEISRPWSLRIPFTSISIGFSEDPENHFAVRWIGELSDGLFIEQLRDAVANHDDGSPKQAFVFVHGYNTSFDAAAYRTAQLAFDMRFPGAPIFFSWPSRGEVEDYEYDQQSALAARDFLIDFLSLIRAESNADIIHLIAHSMGNDPLMEALRDLNQEHHDDAPLFNEVILAAPDIDVDRFRQLARQVEGVAEGFTLYANENDRALGASRRYAGGVRRVGDLPPVISAGIDTIDVSAVGSALFALNHSTYAESIPLLDDMQRLFLERLEPSSRPPLVAIPLPEGTYWQLPGG